MTKGETAEALFKQGYNCCQAVAGAFADEIGLPIDTIAQLTGGFGGGIGRMREVCGTVSGMVFVAGALTGYADPRAITEKAALYARIQKLMADFTAENGSIVCKDLLGLPAAEGIATPEPRTAAYYKKRPCAELCRMAADLVAQEIVAAVSIK